MPGSLSEWLGVYGFLFAVLALVLQYRQYRWSKRSFREQREERVRARAIYNPAMSPERTHWILQVYVVNVGMVPVYIKSVAIGYALKGCTFEVRVPQEDGKENPVAPGDERYYRLKADRYESMKDIAKLPRESVWLSVNTPDREIRRLTGNEMSFIGVAQKSEPGSCDGRDGPHGGAS